MCVGVWVRTNRVPGLALNIICPLCGIHRHAATFRGMPRQPTTFSTACRGTTAAARPTVSSPATSAACHVKVRGQPRHATVSTGSRPEARIAARPTTSPAARIAERPVAGTAARPATSNFRGTYCGTYSGNTLENTHGNTRGKVHWEEAVKWPSGGSCGGLINFLHIVG